MAIGELFDVLPQRRKIGGRQFVDQVADLCAKCAGFCDAGLGDLRFPGRIVETF